MRKVPEAITALNSVPAAAGELRAEALFRLSETYAHARQWPQAHTTIEEMRRAFPDSPWTPRAMNSAGQIAQDTKNTTKLLQKFARHRRYPAMATSPRAIHPCLNHEAKNYPESSRLRLTFGSNADKNTDNPQAGYWAAHSGRAGK
jgi:hypothetical protein